MKPEISRGSVKHDRSFQFINKNGSKGSTIYYKQGSNNRNVDGNFTDLNNEFESMK